MSLIFEGSADLGCQADQEQEHDCSNHNREPKRKKRLEVDDDVYLYDQVGVSVKTPAMEQAEEFRASLPFDNPSFLKTMVRSNVTTGFWLHLPMPFCKTHMPKHNATISLEDEKGEEYRVNYFVDKTALSAGWKKFVSAQNLMEGDIAVFQLVKPYVLKVNVIRAYHAEQNGESFIAVSRKLQDPEILPGTGVVNKKNAKDVLPESNRSKVLTDSNADSGLATHQSGDNSTGLGLGERNGVLGSNRKVEEANSDNDFSVLVYGVSINKELSRYHRAMYHELCCSQDSILHDNLLKNISCKLAAEMISETVNIAEAIGACNASTPQEEYTVWNKTLQGFELLGMKVGFLRARLEKLANLNSELGKYGDAEARRDSLKEDIKIAHGRMRKLKKLTRRLDAKMEELRDGAEMHEKALRVVASAPW